MNSFPLRAHKRKNAHLRGVMLIEAALAVGIAVSLIGLTVSINNEQERRTDAISVGGEKRILLDAARALVQDRREDLIQELFDAAAASGGPGQLVYSAEDLVSLGYIPGSFSPGATMDRLFGQRYALLVRPVFQEDIATPAAILGEIDMDPFGTGEIDLRFLDGDLSNGELGLEAVLFSLGGNPVPPGQAGRILGAAQRINVGFLNGATQSRGIGGTMDFNITGFADFEDYADAGQGRFASPVALGSIGAIGGGDVPNIPELRETFLRCVGLTPGTAGFRDCLSAPRNEVFTNIILRPYDSDDDGTIDTFPAIEGATRIMCENSVGAVEDAVDPDSFLIDCQTTEINGILNVSGSEIQVNGRRLAQVREISGEEELVVTADRVALQLPGGAQRDLSTAPFETLQVPARGVIDVQECHESDISGTPLTPQADGTVAVVLDPWGRAISGSFVQVQRGTGTSESFMQDPNGGSWLVRVMYTLNANFCDATFADPIDIRDTFTSPSDPTSDGRFVALSQRPVICPEGHSSNLADIYELYPVGTANFGAATVTLSCRP